MAETNDIPNERLLDYLYGELTEADAAAFEREVQESPELKAELDSFERTRGAARQALPDVEPSVGIANMLLHEAAQQARSVRQDEREGLWERMLGWFQPLMAHPGLSAAAALVLFVAVVGVVGVSRVSDEAARAPAAAAEASFDEGLAAGDLAAQPEPEAAYGAPPAAPELADLEEEAEAKAVAYGDDADGVVPLSADVGDGFAADAKGAGGRRSADLAGSKEESGLRRAGKNRRSRRDTAGEKQAPAPVAKRKKSRAKYDEPLKPLPQKAAPRSAPADKAGGVGQGQAAAEDDVVFADEAPAPVEAAPPRPRPTTSRSSAPRTQNGAPAAPAPGAIPSGTANDASAEAEVAQAEQRRERTSRQVRNEQTLAQLQTVSKRIKDKTQRCREVARLANNLRDRDVAFYKKRVATESGVRACSAAVTAERQRRVRSRQSNRAQPASEKN